MKKNRGYHKLVGASMLTLLAGSYTALGNESDVEFSFGLGWESRYFSEGRDNLDGDSLLVSDVEFSWKGLSGGIWYGYSPDQRYDELQLSLALNHSIGDWDFYVGVTHLRFPFEDTHDTEIGVGFAYSGLPYELEFSADAYYSIDADGYFAELALGREFELCNNLTASLSGILGINHGYVPDGHSGANHFALSLGLEYAFTEQLALVGHTTYSWAINSDSNFADDETLVDVFVAGVGLRWSF